MSDRFTTVIHRLDTCRVRRVAATILRNTERLIREGLRAEWQYLSCATPQPEEEIIRLASAAPYRRSETFFGFPLGTDADTATEMLRKALVSLIGPDGDLVIAVAVLGEHQNETAARLEVSACAARKRYQRAVARLRTHLEAA
jgi:DNA-directed RNA polymerase specialized sigma24 family protein